MNQPTVLLYVVNPDLEEDQKAWIKEIDASVVVQSAGSIEDAVGIAKSEKHNLRVVCISELAGMDPVGLRLAKLLRRDAAYEGPMIYVGTEEDLRPAEKRNLFAYVFPDFVAKERFQDAAKKYLEPGD